jgi:hypothetical protein
VTKGEERVPVYWTDTALKLVTKYQQNPLRAARVLALVHAAMHDAFVLAEREGKQTEAIAAHRAASLVLAYLYPNETFGRLEAMGIAAALAAAQQTRPERADADAAWRIGDRVAARAIARSRTDGAGRMWPVSRRPVLGAGQWQAAPPLNMYNPAEPFAGTWRTWVLKSGSELAPPPPLDTKSARYDAEVREVKDVAERLTPAQKKIAEDWNLDLGTVTPAGVWNLKAKTLAQEHSLSDAQAVRMFAALNVAMVDAFIACWHAKFRWWTERPVTAIRARYDPAFLPHVITPPFPSYISGHSTVSGAAERVLAAFVPQKAAWLRAQADEAAESRLLGGIHFRSDNEEGLKIGREIGERVAKRVLAEKP